MIYKPVYLQLAEALLHLYAGVFATIPALRQPSCAKGHFQQSVKMMQVDPILSKFELEGGDELLQVDL
jgi:hypothetical protein